MTIPAQPTIIVGGGFAGLFTALHLQKQQYAHPVILIDPHDCFVFKPLLYELLTDEIHRSQICIPYETLLNSKTQFIRAFVRSIDLQNRRLVLNTGAEYDYGKLVISLGSQSNYFKTPGAAQYAFSFTSDAQAIRLKHHLMGRLTQARKTRDPVLRQALLTVAIIGAGPAGVELACTLADILPVWYDSVDGDYDAIRIVLLNRGEEILKGDINDHLRQIATTALDQRTIAIEKCFGITIAEITEEGVAYDRSGQREFINSATVIWTAGTQPHCLLQTLAIAPQDLDRSGRLRVRPTLQLPDYPEVFVGGDCAYLPEAPKPATAQVAYQQGKAIAQNLVHLATGKAPQPAQISLRGTLLKLGMAEGVASLFNRVELIGEVGRLLRQATYLELLPTPSYNLRQTTEWLTDEVFQRHQVKSINPRHYGKTPFLRGMAATAASVMLAMPLAWRALQPTQFDDRLAWTGVPELLNQLTPDRNRTTQ
ncbi:MAG: NAD(P)/FAD-dependent oxidoreductase [Synechococcales bacterium]|nr:NAD(P)/FAD-dependent oxidoreductase [Synechococcales bacterium]